MCYLPVLSVISSQIYNNFEIVEFAIELDMYLERWRGPGWVPVP